VVISPCSIPNASFSTRATGASAFVVQEPMLTMTCLLRSYAASLTPNTNVRSPPFAGAETSTPRAPAARCLDAPSRSVKRPVASSTTPTPIDFHGSFAGSFSLSTVICLPLTCR